MNPAVISKTFRDSRLLFVISLLGITLLELLFVVALSEFFEDMKKLWVQRTFIQRFVKMFLGTSFQADFTLTGMMCIGFAHPILMGLLWSFLLTTCTRVFAAETERGTADLLLTLPLSRTAVYCSTTAVWLGQGIALTLCVLLGTWLGASIFQPEQPLEVSRLAKLIPNLFALYCFVGGVTMCVSIWTLNRGLTIAWVLGWLLASLLFNFLGQFWSVAVWLSYFGPMSYYQPLASLNSTSTVVFHSAILFGAGLAAWLIGWWRIVHRDIPTA